MANYTKGPWFRLDDGEANFCNIGSLAEPAKWLMRIQQNGEKHTDEQLANAQLIACAPEMLEMLQELMPWISHLIHLCPTGETRNKITDANIKAQSLIKKAIL